jgi:hypothetical protein
MREKVKAAEREGMERERKEIINYKQYIIILLIQRLM